MRLGKIALAAHPNETYEIGALAGGVGIALDRRVASIALASVRPSPPKFSEVVRGEKLRAGTDHRMRSAEALRYSQVQPRAVGPVQLPRRSYFLHCVAPLPVAPGASPFRIKGEIYRNIQLSIEHLDKKSGGAVRRALEEAGLAAFAGQWFLASTYYDVLPMPRIMMAMAAGAGRDLFEFTRRLGEAGAKLQFETGVYRRNLAGWDPDTFATRLSAFMGAVYDHGPLSITIGADGHEATIVRPQVPLCAAEWWCVATMPYITFPLESAGLRVVRSDWKFRPQGIEHGVPMSTLELRIGWEEPA